MDEDLLEKAKEQAVARVGKKYFGEALGSEQQMALRYFFEEMLNELMRAERAVFLEKQVDEEYTDLLMSLVVNGYSESQVLRSLRQLGLPYSEAQQPDIANQNPAWWILSVNRDSGDKPSAANRETEARKMEKSPAGAEIQSL